LDAIYACTKAAIVFLLFIFFVPKISFFALLFFCSQLQIVVYLIYSSDDGSQNAKRKKCVQGVVGFSMEWGGGEPEKENLCRILVCVCCWRVRAQLRHQKWITFWCCVLSSFV
jgi:hypothetical protein